jgi:tape measure domain-containing protein
MGALLPMSDTTIRIVIDAGGARSGGTQAERALDRVGAASQRLNRALGTTSVNVTTFGRSLAGLKGAGAALILADIARRFMAAADASAFMEAKLKLATRETYSFGRAQKDVRDIARSTRSELTSVGTLYAKMATNGKLLKATQDQIARATESVTKATKISGATTSEQQATVLQLGQALSSGKLNGDEFRSLAENAPRLMKLFADSIGKPVGALKKLASEGKLTSDLIFKALTDPKFTAGLDEEFKSIPPSFGDAMTAVKNASIEAFGAFDKGGQLSKKLFDFASGATGDIDRITSRMATAGAVFSNIVGNIVNNIGLIGGALALVASAKVGLFAAAIGGRAVAALVAFRTANLAAIASAMMLARVAPVAGGAALALTGLRAAGSGLMALFGGPLGLAIAGLTVALGYMMTKGAETSAILSGLDSSLKSSADALLEAQTTAGTAAATVASVGTESNGAVAGITNFAGAVGNAATQLYRLADAKRTAAIQDAREAVAKTMNERTGLFSSTNEGRSQRAHKNGLSFRNTGIFFQTLGDKLGIGPTEEDKQAGLAKNRQELDNRRKTLATLEGTSREAFAPSNGSNLVSPPSDPTKNKHHGKSDAERDAESEAKASARRTERSAEFLKSLEDQAKVAAFLPADAERLNAELELQRIHSDGLKGELGKISDIDKQRIADAIKLKQTNELIRDMTAANDNGARELDFAKRKVGMSEKEALIAEAAWEYESRALADKQDITDAEFQKQLAMVKSRAGETFEIEKQNRLLKTRESLLSTYSSHEGQQQELEQIASDRKQLDSLRGKSEADGGITEDQYRRALSGLNRAGAEIATRFQNEMGEKINALGDQFGGVFGKAISKFGQLLSSMANAAKGDFAGLGPIGGILDIVGKRSDGSLNGIGDAAAKASKKSLDKLMGSNGETSAFKNPLKALGDGFGDFKGDMKNIFGKGGDLAKGLGSVLGKAGAGMQMGTTADGLMKALGVKSSKMGAQIGGALGSTLFGPIGGIIGGIGGGLIGGLFKKTKSGAVVINSATEEAVASGKLGSSLGGSASSVQSSLNQLSDQLGGTLGAFSVAIGKRGDYYRVDASGSASNASKKNPGSGIIYDGKDEAEAIKIAFQNALQDGAIQGISDFSKRVLGAAKDLDRAVALATKYETIVKELAAFDDPIGAPLAELNKAFSKLRDEMIANKATTAELANVDRYYMIQRQNMLKDQLSELQTFREKLTGSGSGVSTKNQLDAKMAEFSKYEQDISAGKAVDTTKFAALGSSIFDLAKELYGTSTAQFQNIRGQLIKANDNAESTIKSIYEADASANVAKSVDAQTQLIAENLKLTTIGNGNTAVMVTLLEKIAANINRATPAGAVNGVQAGTV